MIVLNALVCLEPLVQIWLTTLNVPVHLALLGKDVKPKSTYVQITFVKMASVWTNYSAVSVFVIQDGLVSV